jgi:tetratricopeptide (TPR) repeat protein
MKSTTAILLSFVLLGGLSAVGYAQVSQDRFNRANQLYEQGNYAGALALYLETGNIASHWKVFYNTANCYYKLNQPVQAKIYYLRARRLEPFDPSIQKNIEIVNKRLKDDIPSPTPDFISRVLMRIESVLSLNLLSIVLVVMIVIFNGFVLVLLRKGKNRFILYGVSFSLLLAILLAGYHIYRVGKYNRRDIAVVTQENTQLRSGPGENNTVLFKVNPGLEVKIIDRSGNKQWLQVSASAEIAGWVEASRLEVI